MGRKFSMRSRESELMDDPSVPYEEFYDCLLALEKINVLTFAARPTMVFLRKVLSAAKSPVSILDVGSGSGDMLGKAATLARRMRKNVELTGLDLNPWAEKAARKIRGDASIRFHTGDAFTFEPGKPVDIVISSLFTHHLTDGQIISFLRWMDKTARTGWIVNDLHRHPVPYWFIKFATALFSSNRLIRNDAAVSVARAFRKDDWLRYIREAGLDDRRVRIRWFFPFRYSVSCLKP